MINYSGSLTPQHRTAILRWLFSAAILTPASALAYFLIAYGPMKGVCPGAVSTYESPIDCLAAYHGATLLFALGLLIQFVWHLPQLLGTDLPPSRFFQPLRSYRVFAALFLSTIAFVTTDAYIQNSRQIEHNKICSPPQMHCEFSGHIPYGNKLTWLGSQFLFGLLLTLPLARIAILAGLQLQKKRFL